MTLDLFTYVLTLAMTFWVGQRIGQRLGRQRYRQELHARMDQLEQVIREHRRP